MKYLVYIVLFISGFAFAQEDAHRDSIMRNPVIVTTQKLQGSMPNAAIIRSESYSELPKTINGQISSHASTGLDTHYNPYHLTKFDKDSIYNAACNSNIVQQARKAKFNGKSKLYERGYELEFISLLMRDSISNDLKKKLLTGRLLADWQHDEKNCRPTDYKKNEFITDGLNLNGNELYVTTEGPHMHNKGDRKAALADFVMHHNTVNFSRMLYIIENRPYEVISSNSLQVLIAKLRQINIVSVTLLTGGIAASVYGNSGVNGVVVIKSKPN